jgi:hypothetical protein
MVDRQAERERGYRGTIVANGMLYVSTNDSSSGVGEVLVYGLS